MDENRQAGFKELEKHNYHWLVIKERKSTVNNEQVKAIHDGFKAFCEQYSMNNFTMGLDILLTAFFNTQELDQMEHRIAALELKMQELVQPKSVEPLPEVEDEGTSTF